MKLLPFLLFVIFPFFVVAQPQNESRAIDFTGKDLKGKEINLSDYRGQLVLIDFWAAWCGPCRRENPNIVEAYHKYKKTQFKNAKGFVVLNVSLDKTEEDWKQAIKTDKLDWKSHVWDKDRAISTKYGVRSIPYGFLVDGEGKIIAQGTELRGIGLHIQIEKQFVD